MPQFRVKGHICFQMVYSKIIEAQDEEEAKIKLELNIQSSIEETDPEDIQIMINELEAEEVK